VALPLGEFKTAQSTVFGVKFSLREIEKRNTTKIRNFRLWKMPKLLNFRFLEVWYFLNCDNEELKRSSKINFPVSEQQRWAVVG